MHFPVEQSPATLAAKPQKNEEDRIRLKMIQALNQALREANFDEVGVFGPVSRDGRHFRPHRA